MRRFALFMLVVGLFVLPNTAVHASYVQPLSIEQATDAAALIVRAVCVDVAQGQYKKGQIVDMDTVGEAAAPRVVINASTFRIKEVLKNTTDESYGVGDTFVIKQFAGFKGRTGKLMKTSMPLPVFKKDAEYMLFYPAKKGLTSPIGIYQGVFEVVNGVVTSPAMKAMIKRSAKTTRMTKALGVGKAPGEEPPSAMPVDDFSGMIKSLVGDEGGAR